MKIVVGALMVAATLSMSATAVAGDAAAGKAKSESCVACHGMNGRSTNPNNPSLAGQKKNYLIKAMKDYKDGKRQDPMMTSMMAALTDADMENLAEFYSSIK
ncbi:c-type cytochrome [Kaarinaea lacus]